jgi:hypothetical protein
MDDDFKADPAAASCMPTCAPHGRFDAATSVGAISILMFGSLMLFFLDYF